MLQREFEELTGMGISSEEYKEVEKVYMNTNLGKAEFCRVWKKATPESRSLMIGLAKACDSYQVAYERAQDEAVQKMRDERVRLVMDKVELGHFLADEAQEYSSAKAREKAIEVLGPCEYIAYRFKKGWGLWKDDEILIIQSMEK